ncbi:MAG TPA: glycosyltransferase [Acidimicrobiales bacterium]|nr:glycosyltransferase [Acidimicrobiales bacterium]
MPPDLIVFSHLRWTGVWQRPQHLISRLAAGRRTWFVEEPEPGTGSEPRLRTERHGPVTRVWMELPELEASRTWDRALAEAHAEPLCRLVGPGDDRWVWLQTPMAFDMVAPLEPRRLVYDVMDDLAAFAGAPEGLVLHQRRTLHEADIVFTGGRSLHRSVVAHRPTGTHLFPSGVDPAHYEPARRHRRRRHRQPEGRPVAGYVGVIDERVDLDLVAGLADHLPGWDVQMVGPVAKIDPMSLPPRPNVAYPGQQPYSALPEVMGGFDVALMPFARNEATASISPTKTLEYLAAGLPVVSTRVPDVVADHSSVVCLQDDAEGFAAACRRVRGDDLTDRDRKLAPLLARQDWDRIAERMRGLIERLDAPAVPAGEVTA